MEFCLAAERNPGMQLSRQWREQPNMDILGIRSGHSEAEGGGGVRGQRNLRWGERESRIGKDE